MTSDEYRQNAELCRAQAERSKRPSEKEAWLKLAQDWLMLAQRSAPKDLAKGSANLARTGKP
jgi:hypothetical protein